jgi:hypothetical protein
MMKKITILVCFAIISLLSNPIAFAEAVDFQSAKTVATAKLKSLAKDSEFMISSTAFENISNNNQLLCYIFQLEPTGFIVVAADNNLPPVIAYSFTDDFSFENNGTNPVLSMLKTDLTLRLSNIAKLPASVIQQRKNAWNFLSQEIDQIKPDFLFQQWPPEGTTSTGGWLETNYTQSPPYNNFCPWDQVTNQRSIAGCPSTAMAQVLNYFKTTNNTQFTDADDYHHNYAGRNYWIDDDYIAIDFPSFPDLNAYLDTVNMSFESNSLLKNNEKAALTFACGVAAHQVYTSQGSGTFGVIQAEEAYLRFGFADALLLQATDTSLYIQLSQNMMDARPAHLAIVDPGWTMGHNVVVDGYNTDQYFHLNFGWGGSYNGWYLLPDEIPYGLTVIEGLIVNIAFPAVNTGLTLHQADRGLSLHIYPVPASNELHVAFTIHKPSQVKVEIYSVTGSLIQTLMDEPVTVGSYTCKLDISDNDAFAKGVYVCKIQADDQFISQKIIVR